MEFRNFVFLCILFLSLYGSIKTSIYMLKKTGNRWLSMLASFCINSFLLLIAALVLYKLDAQTFHNDAGSLGIVVYPFFIPILTLVNYHVLVFVTNRDRS